jgi:hypothetical protein
MKPHPATVLQRSSGPTPQAARSAHPATLQRRAAPQTAPDAQGSGAQPAGLPPHPATIQRRADPRTVPGAQRARLPSHPATIARGSRPSDGEVAGDSSTSILRSRAKAKGKKKSQEQDRNRATRVLGDFQMYGRGQIYGRVLNQLIRGADVTEKAAIQLMIGWIMVHPVWSKKENLGHGTQGPGAAMHADTIREVNQIKDDMENWIEKKWG